MPEPMSEEYIEDLRRDVMSQIASAGGSTRHSDAYTQMLDEIDRLRSLTPTCPDCGCDIYLCRWCDEAEREASR